MFQLWVQHDQMVEHIQNVFNLWPLGKLWSHSKETFKMYPTFDCWAHCDHILSVFPMCSVCAHWVFGSMSPVTSGDSFPALFPLLVTLLSHTPLSFPMTHSWPH